MNRRAILYLFSGLIVASLVLAVVFFVKRPEKLPAPPVPEGEKKTLVFKDVKYSGEKKGAIDWEIHAAVAKKSIDKPLVEMEGVKGLYKPKKGVNVSFSAEKSSLDTEKETGNVQDVEIIYNKEYTMRSRFFEFDFKKGVAGTTSPVTIKGPKVGLGGTGMTVNTKDEIVRLERDVNGSVETAKGKMRFQADRLIYRVKESLYVLDGHVRMHGTEMNVQCVTLYLYEKGGDLEKLVAQGKVVLTSKRITARGENAVYYFREDRMGPSGPGPAPGKETKPSVPLKVRTVR